MPNLLVLQSIVYLQCHVSALAKSTYRVPVATGIPFLPQQCMQNNTPVSQHNSKHRYAQSLSYSVEYNDEIP